MTELKNRGISDVLVLCCDGLKGLPDAARATWELVDVQLCVVHLVRNSLRYASKKHWAQITRELREIYTAPSMGAAEVSFDAFAATWEPVYPAMVKASRDAWEDFEPFLEFPVELRTIVYSTDEIVNHPPVVVGGVASGRRRPRRPVRRVRRVPSLGLVAA
jgi:transposase-like protein